MNDYAQRLAELQQQPDHELKQIGDQWQTPEAIAHGLFWHFGPKLGPVVLDLFASDANALAPNYYTAEINALTQEWANDLRQLGGAAFANPPYSRPESDSDGTPITGIENILAYCREQRELGAKIMLLIKAGTSEGWWPEDADFIQFVAGRIGFKAPNWYVPRDPKKDKPSSSGFASAVVIFDKDWKWERRPIERLNRNDLETQGRMIMNMIESRATVIAESMVPVVAAIEPPATTEPAPIEESDCQFAEVADDNYQLDLDASEEPELTYADKTLDELEPDFQSFGLVSSSWNRFVAEMTVRFGFPDKYSHREVMFVLTSIDTDGEMTGTTEEQKSLIHNCTVALTETEKRLTMTNNQRQDALAALFIHIKNNPLPPLFEQVKIIRAALLADHPTETDIAHELSGNSEPQPVVSPEVQEHQGTGEIMQEVDGDTLTDALAEQEESATNEFDTAKSIAEWLREKYMQLENYPDMDEHIKEEIIEKTIRAIEEINDEYSSKPNAPKAEIFIDDYFSSKPNIRTYMNIRSLRAAFRSLVHTSMMRTSTI